MMRDILNKLDSVISESRGLGARKPGEEFVSTTNPEEKIYVDNVAFFPQSNTEYPSYEEMVAELKTTVTSLQRRASVDLVANFKPTDRAFGIATFKREDGSLLAFVKPFKSVHLDRMQVNWNNQTGIPGYRYNSKSAAKTQAGMTPQDVLTSQLSDLTPVDIVQQIAAKFGAKSPLTQFAQAIAAGQKLPISIPATGELSFSAFRDYFCELMHPIALQTGNYSGNAGDAAAKFLGKNGFAGTSINFGDDKTEGLSDSVMIADDGRKIKVSSKGTQGGAAASAKNLLNAVQELDDPKLLKKHQGIIRMISEMVARGQTGAPISMGVNFGIIDEIDYEMLPTWKKLAPMTMDQALKMKMSPKMKALIRGRNTDNPDSVNIYYHAIAAIAHKVAEEINSTDDFSRAASEILNNGALVQVYTNASESGGKWVVKGFDTVFPGETVTGVKFSAGKTYYSTGIKGNFTFKILRNGAKDIGTDDPESAIASVSKVAAPSVVTGKRVELRPKRAPKVNKPSGDPGLGRARR